MTRFPDAAQLAARAHEVVLGAKAAGLSLATAESLTAGMIAATIAEVPGASAVLTGGIISYSNAVKVSLLGVEEALLGERGSVDGEVARQMAQGARTACDADLAVSATGVAGPEAHDGQPVGTVFLGWADGSGSGFIEHHFSGDRAQVRARSTLAALDLLFSHLVPSRHTA
ncbi:CinA family protein [Paeniglutamicibacter gangotriensis]|uniref:CinA family protein n=1 Tax=Paeniglutamicibacter gangotriensis TaxID=254787 RepID=A0A5B0E957_9MICC|nr:CinA family protein [Paeniglutamicibacter gangotriensis]KAA0974411.1 CinA family protein [Paeniglutamicibacter gangotriensis]